MLLWVHVVALAIFGVATATPLQITLLGPALVAACTLAATQSVFSPTTRASMATLGLLMSSAILIGLCNGLIEAHFHFFITIAVVSLYQSWRPYLLAVGFVVAHHLVLGTLVPHLVYNHHMATHNPWVFALVHGGAVLAESAACLVFWKVTEEALDAERKNRVALEEANDKLAAANRAVSDLVAMLSHDLRVPLTVLIGYSEMALESWPQMNPTEQVAFVHRVNRAGQTLRTMLEDSLTVSVLDGDGIEPRRTLVRVDEAVRDALAALPGPAPIADLSELSAVTALVDRGHLAQVLTNLLTNAVKYGGGQFAVGTCVRGDSILVRIVDTGPGVPTAFVPHLFDRFTRSDEARDSAQKGTGLGLYICRSLLVANGGDITYESTPGGGATFCLHLARPEERPQRG